MAILRQNFPVLGGAVNRGHSLTPHPADGTIAHVDCGDGAWIDIPDPTAETPLEWSMRYGDPESVRFTVASILSSYQYLLCAETTKEAQRRIALARRAVRELWEQGPLPDRSTFAEDVA
ncbi:hypothetical protein [Sphingopyxis sp. 550A]